MAEWEELDVTWQGDQRPEGNVWTGCYECGTKVEAFLLSSPFP